MAGEREKAIIEALCVDKKNIVFVVSSKSVHSISEYFGDFKHLGLAAEHGYYFRWPAHKFSSANLVLVQQTQTYFKWQSTLSPVQNDWQATVKPIMEIFVRNTYGSYIEEYEHSLIWQYGDADREFGYMQSKQLEDYLIIT